MSKETTKDRSSSRSISAEHILVVTVGLPQSGKSTWAHGRINPCVNPDAIRLAIHGQPYISSAEPYVWATAQTMVKALFLAGHRCVILDATNTTAKRREMWRSNDWNTRYVLFDTPVDVCIERASASAWDEAHEEGLIAAIKRMHENFEPLTDEERQGAIGVERVIWGGPNAY